MHSLPEIRRPRHARACRALAGAMCFGLAALAGIAQAQSGAAAPVIYPAKGQTGAQQDSDKYQCHDWARTQTGFDPLQSPQGGTPAPTSSAGVSAAGMAKGAMGGAAVAELSDHDAGKGAAAGAMGAALFERARQRQVAQAKEQQAAQQQAQRSQQRAAFGRAFSACMEGRGYVVK